MMNITFTKTHKILALGCIFCFLLLTVRILTTGSLYYSFLVWNLFLAGIPYAISQSLRYSKWAKEQTFIVILVLGIWLLFLPNAPYIITDLMHLRYTKSSLLWFDALLIFSFAWNGLLFGVLSLMDVFAILSTKFGKVKANYSLFVMILLCGFGIYLGRFLRWNSWEAFTQPFQLLAQCKMSLTHPDFRLRAWGITLGFGFFFWVMFVTAQHFLTVERLNSK